MPHWNCEKRLLFHASPSNLEETNRAAARTPSEGPDATINEGFRARIPRAGPTKLWWWLCGCTWKQAICTRPSADTRRPVSLGEGRMAVHKGRMVCDQYRGRTLGQPQERPSKTGDTPDAVPTRACAEQRCESRLRWMCLLRDKNVMGSTMEEAHWMPGHPRALLPHGPSPAEPTQTAGAHGGWVGSAGIRIPIGLRVPRIRPADWQNGAGETTSVDRNGVVVAPQTVRGWHARRLTVSRRGSGATLGESYLPVPL